jgi:hypothetical protein
MYSHPIGMHGHGAGPLIGLWDYQDGVPGRGDAKIIPSMWFSSELQTTTPVPEWEDNRSAWRRRKTSSSVRTGKNAGRTSGNRAYTSLSERRCS